MKKFLKIAAAIFGVLLLIIAGVATWVNFSASPVHPVKAIDVSSVPVPVDARDASDRAQEYARVVADISATSEVMLLNGLPKSTTQGRGRKGKCRATRF